MRFDSIKLVFVYLPLLFFYPANAQTIVTPPKPEDAQASNPSKIIPKGTPILIEITDLVSTKTAVRDDFFNIKLATPIIFNGEIIIPAGTIGKGQVVDSGKPRAGGGSGQLVIAARYLEYNGQKIPLRGLKLEVSGTDRSGTSAGVSSVASLAGPVGALAGFFVSGGHMEVPAGTHASAKLGIDYIINSDTIPPKESNITN